MYEIYRPSGDKSIQQNFLKVQHAKGQVFMNYREKPNLRLFATITCKVIITNQEVGLPLCYPLDTRMVQQQKNISLLPLSH